MTWIEVIDEKSAEGKLAKLYKQVEDPKGHVDNILKSHSLRPHTLTGHMALYKNVLHHSANSNPKWLLELIGVWVSQLNQCDYCVEHHLAGFLRLVDDPKSIFLKVTPCGLEDRIRDCLIKVNWTEFHKFIGSALSYAECLTIRANMVRETHIRNLRSQGFSDGEILEINQVTAYFNYANRTVLGLGVHTEGDTLGLSPSGEDWRHH